jgi:hypothetical protein
VSAANDAPTITAQLRLRGAAIVPGAIDAPALGAIAASAKNYFAAQIAAGAPRTRYGGAAMTKLLEAGYDGVLGILDIIANSAIRRAVEAFYGEPVVMPLYHALFRYYYPEGSEYRRTSPFHQDLAGVDPRAAVTSWIPLDPCGVVAPGLEIVEASLEALIPVDTEGADKDFGVGPDRVLPQYGDRLLHPAYAVGDAALFRNTTLHRTYITPAMTEPRLNFDCRYIPRSRLAPGEVPPVFHPLG